MYWTPGVCWQFSGNAKHGYEEESDVRIVACSLCLGVLILQQAARLVTTHWLLLEERFENYSCQSSRFELSIIVSGYVTVWGGATTHPMVLTQSNSYPACRISTCNEERDLLTDFHSYRHHYWPITPKLLGLNASRQHRIKILITKHVRSD